MNIIWKLPNNTLAITSLLPEIVDHLAKMNNLLPIVQQKEKLLSEFEEGLLQIKDQKGQPDETLQNKILGLSRQLTDIHLYEQTKENIGLSAEEHAALLQKRGDIPSEWVLLSIGDVSLPTDGSHQDDWRFVNGEVVVDADCVAKRLRDSVQGKIDTLERESMLNRGSREMQLFQMEERASQVAAEKGIPLEVVLAANIYYKKLKALDTEISLLRDSVV